MKEEIEKNKQKMCCVYLHSRYVCSGFQLSLEPCQ